MKENLNQSDILSTLRSEKVFLEQQFGVVEIGLFGSYARNEQVDDSDIDLIVEFIAPRFDWLAGLQDYMEQKFDKRVEIVRKKNIEGGRFIKFLQKDIIYV